MKYILLIASTTIATILLFRTDRIHNSKWAAIAGYVIGAFQASMAITVMFLL